MGLCRFICDHCVICRHIMKKEGRLKKLLLKMGKDKCPVCRRAAREREAKRYGKGNGDGKA